MPITTSDTHHPSYAGNTDLPVTDTESVITDALFREKFLDHTWRRELGILLFEASVPVIIFHTFVDWRWLFAWEVLWMVSAGWRLLLRHRYHKLYPFPRRPRNSRTWRMARHGYHAYTWFVTGLLGLFCFVPHAIAWEIAAVAGLGMLYTLAPSDAIERSEILAGAITLPLALVIMLLIKGTPLHLGLAALLVGFIVMLATWGAQQVKARRNEIYLRMALHREKQRAEEASIAKSRFLAAASHDLRQPLHALTLFVEALKTQIQSPNLQAMVENIENSVQSLDGLFNALLDISKLDAGTVVPQPSHFALDRLLHKLSAEYRVQAQAKGLDWMCDCPAAVVHTDPVLLETLIRNLISNAIRYTEQGTINIACHARDKHLRLSVSDTGIGIPEDRQQEIFREFVQLDNPERDRNKGLGLGLSIVERLTSLLHMPLNLVSSAGAGATFTLYIPDGDPSALPIASMEVTVAAHVDPLLGKIIMVIDDDPSILKGMRMLIESWQSLPILADSIPSGLDRLNELNILPDILIVDFRLRNDVTGTEVIHRLREHLHHPVPALIVTGDTAPERLKEATAAGFHLLHKPVKPAKLRLAIQHLLKS